MGKLIEIPNPPVPPNESMKDVRMYLYNRRLSVITSLNMIITEEEIFTGEYRTHLSMADPKGTRYPTWDQLGEVKDLLFPDLFMCIPHPPREYWFNSNPTCLHFWEIKDKQMILDQKRQVEVTGSFKPSGVKKDG